MISLNILKDSNIVERLKPFVLDIRKLVEGYEKSILDISSSLPELENQIDENLNVAKAFINYISSEGGDSQERGVRKDLDAFHIKLNESLTKFIDCEDIDRAIFFDLRESIELASEAMKKTGQINQISDDLKVFAINSIIYSMKAGTKGRGYQVISSDFIRLSEDIASGTDEIARMNGETDIKLQKFIKKVSHFEGHIQENSGCVSDESKGFFINSNDSVSNFVILLKGLFERIEAVKVPLAGIMVDMQTQDIIQQQLIHIMDAMEDILVVVENYNKQAVDNLGAIRDILTLLQFLLNTVDKQLERLIQEVEVMINNIKSKFEMMTESVEDIQSDRQMISEIIVGNKFSSVNSVVELIFQPPKDMISDIRNGYSNGLRQKKDILKLFGEIMRDNRSEVKIVKSFLPKSVAIDNLLVLAKIEQARYKLDLSGGQGESSVDFIRLNSFSELENIVEDVTSSLSMVEKHYKRSVKIIKQEEGNFDSIDMDLSKSLETINETESEFMNSYDEILNITNDLFSYIDGNFKIFEEVEKSVEILRNKVAGFTDIRTSVEEMIVNAGGAISIGDCTFKDTIIQNIVDKCTVDSERVVLSQEYDDLEIEETTGSNITLF